MPLDAMASRSLEALADAGSVEPAGRAPGACAARARLGGVPVVMAATDPALDSGAIGRKEAVVIGAAAAEAQARGVPLVLLLDSAGARLTEGVAVLGAFRRLQGAIAAAVEAGVPVAAVLGRHCFGGASLLACSARARFYGRHTLFGLSGPRALGGAAGVRLSPEVVDGVYGVQSRLPRDPAGVLADAAHLPAALRAWCREPAPAESLRGSHALLRRALPRDDTLRPGPAPVELVDQLDPLFPDGWQAQVVDGAVSGEARTRRGPVAFAGFVQGHAVSPRAALWLAGALLEMDAAAGPDQVVLLLDSPGQSTSLDHERLLPSMAVAHACAAAARLLASGRHVALWLAGQAGGAIYVALAAAAHQVMAFSATRLQTLPLKAVDGVIGAGMAAEADPQACLAAGVVDRWVGEYREAGET
jgi:hypothetical protein